MRRNNWLIILFLMTCLSCTDKEIDIEVVQDECKRFKINTPSYVLIEDPCQSGTKISFRVRFGFNRSADCLHQLSNRPQFLTVNNTDVTPTAFTSIVGRNDLSINDKSVEYTFTAEFADQATAKQLNHIILDFNTQDELGVSSNTLQIRVNTTCSTVDPNSYNVNNNSVQIQRNQSIFTIRLWDNAAEDGDIVSVYLNGINGIWLIENHTLTNAGNTFTFDTALLRAGANDLVVFALNEGSSGPNTVSIAVNGQEIPNFKPGLTTGEAVRINF